MRELLKSLLNRRTAQPTDTSQDQVEPVLPGRLEQTSKGFDSENVGLFLHWVNANSDIRLPEEFIDDILFNLPDIAVNTNKAFTAAIQLASQPEALRLNIFMDDVDSPQLYFFGSAEVVAEMSKALQGFSAELES